MSFLSLFLLFLLCIQAVRSNACFETERIGLLTFKSNLQDPGHLLHSWSENSCCNWRGISCQKHTGHILKLNLRNSDDSETFGSKGAIDSSLLALTHLAYLDLSGNNFNGTEIPSFLGLFENLVYLNLSFSNFRGVIPHLGENIEVLSLASNSLEGNLFGLLPKMLHLTHIDLSNNSLSGVVPLDIGKLSNVTYLDLSSNLLEGVLSELHFNELTRLQVLRPSSNTLKITLNNHWFPKFQLEVLALESCRVGPKFPSWLESQLSISILNLQDTNIQDTLPFWFWNQSYRLVDIANNELKGHLPQTLTKTLSVLDISSNYISGRFPPNISNMLSLEILDVSNNQITGTIPSQICDIHSLSILDLSNNNFTGKIPDCIWRSKLSIINLSYNNLSGKISSDIASLIHLKVLALNNNQFNGEIPTGLRYCKNLTFLNLANNNLSGKIPTFIGENISNLVYLQLRENKFAGEIPSQLALLSNLQVLDLANNNLLGSVPPSFGNFSALSSMKKYTISAISFHFPSVSVKSKPIHVMYVDQLAIITKGQVLEYSNTLYLVKTIDLSRNNLSGSIPSEIVALEALENLNLTQNSLNGRIPDQICNMKSLDSLDLSFNKLSNSIPQSISYLIFLSHLNLSYNNLSGEIPIGNQLNTLNDSSIYIGNVFLCGSITNRSCLTYEAKNNTGEVKNKELFIFLFYFSVGCGFFAGLWLVWCFLLVNTVWRASYIEMVDDMYYKCKINFS